MDREDEETRAAVARAIAHFNSGRYHDALDEFEVPYHRLVGTAREFYLGLVRISAALYHHRGGRPTSARKLYESGRTILVGFTPRARGIEVESLIAELDLAFAPLIAAPADGASHGPAPPGPPAGPQIVVGRVV